MGKKKISIMNFNHDAKLVRFTSPRTLEACKRSGILPEELTKLT